MPTIIVRTQSELDALPKTFAEFTIIEIRATARISVEARENSSVVARGNSSVEARGNSSVEARGNSSVVAWENSSVVARGNSSVVARENSSVEAWENSSVVAWENSSVEAWENSSVEARENSSVEARGNSSVVARGNSSVEAWENSSVEAWENSSVEARGNSSVVARGNSSVEAWGNSSVVAWENSSVEAWENSSVEAWENVGVHVFSPSCPIELFGFAVAWLLAKTNKVKKSSETATVIIPERKTGTQGWVETEGVSVAEAKLSVIIFKRVSEHFKTQEGTANETQWEIGVTLAHKKWDPTTGECGEGKYHACSRPYFCDEFRSGKKDRYVAIEVSFKDLHAWDNGAYPHKIAFRAGTVLHECNRFGKKIA